MILFARLFQRFFQARAGVLQVLLRRSARQEFIDRLAQRTVPILVEAVAQLLGDRADAEHVDVGEIQVGLGIEILVPQVTAANDGGAVVRQPQLVVHAPVLQRQIEQPPHGPRHAGAAAQVQRVEQADLDLRVRRQRGDDPVEAIAGGVVEQDSHAYATVGSLEQFVHQHPCADAVMDDVVLQVEAALGVADQFGTGHERFAAIGQQTKARLALMGRGLGLD
ncbi:hypothetical protein D3C84_684990 [compost metagenome]